MAELYISGLSVPPHIKDALSELSRKYAIEKEVTKGANGYLFFGKNRVLNTSIAIKIYYWGSDKQYHAEPQHLAQINSPNVLSIFDAGYIDHDWAYFVTPHCSGGDLDDLLSQTQVGNLHAIDLTSQVLNGLSYLHGERFLHRDIKPANIYLDHDLTAIIGDFGSLKRVPDGKSAVPASSQAVLYRPPESVDSNEYDYLGDVYQAGIVLYQLLGGYLPYEETSWLSKQELTHYSFLASSADRSIYVDQCIHARIKKGKLLDLDSLPAWVPDTLRRVVRKACNVQREKRFASPADFMAKLNEIRTSIPNWAIEDGHPTYLSLTSYRLIAEDGVLRVQKRRSREQWRNDRSFVGSTLCELVEEINSKITER